MEMIMLLILVILVSGISKVAFAGSLGLLAMPLMMLAFPAHKALSLLLPILMTLDVLTIRNYWKQWSVEILIIILPAAAVGVVLAGSLLGQLPEHYLRLLIGGGCMIFALRYLLPGMATARWLASRPAGVCLGLLSGLSSTLLHAGGPPLSLYLLSRQLPVSQYLATSALFLATLNLLKLPAFILQGQLQLADIVMVLPFLPLTWFAVKLGLLIRQRIDDKLYQPVFYCLLLLAGARLVWQATI